MGNSKIERAMQICNSPEHTNCLECPCFTGAQTDLCAEGVKRISTLIDRCARYAEEIMVLREQVNWISTEERLPRAGERVLATDGEFVGEAYKTSAGTWRRSDGLAWRDLFGKCVTHWMPLPNAQKRGA